MSTRSRGWLGVSALAVPANRRELVMLLWETAGKPEAALPSLYSDVPAEEIELQKATRWAIDNGLVKPADDSDAEPKAAQDLGFMYSRDLDDPDGNSLGVLYMEPMAAEQGPDA